MSVKFPTIEKRVLASTLLALAIAMSTIMAPASARAMSINNDEVNITVSHNSRSGISTCSWYGESLSFISSASTSTRNFDGSNIGLELTASCSKRGYFTVTLVKVSSGGSTSIGSAQFNSNGFTKATWSNISPGEYKFTFTSSLGSLISTSGLSMYSW